MRTLHDALRREQQRLQNRRWNVTFTDVATIGTDISAGIAKVTMPKSAPHPLRSGGIEGP